MRIHKTGIVPSRYLIILIVLSISGACMILFGTMHYGAGFTPDSVVYLSSARDLINGESIVNLIYFPPLYPAILALTGVVFDKDPITFAHIINAFFFGSTIFLSGLIFFRQIKPPLLAVLGPVLVLVSVPLVPIHLLAVTEPVFLFLILLFFLLLDLYREKRTWVLILLLALITSLASLTRYIGILIILTGWVSIILNPDEHPKTRKIEHSLVFLVLSTLPISIWIMKNYSLSGSLFGARGISNYTYFQNLVSALYNVSVWYLPGKIRDAYSIRILLATLLILILASGIKKGWFKNAIILRNIPVAFFVVIYTVFLVISSRTAFLGLIDSRYMSPIFVPLNLLVASFIERRTLMARISPVKGLLLILFACAVLVYPTWNTISVISNHHSNGSEFTSKAWRQSEILEFMSQNIGLAKECTVYSNGADAIYLLLNKNVKPIPTKRAGIQTFAEISDLRGNFPPENHACIVWFNQITWRTYLFRPEELVSVTRLSEVFQFEDGMIFFVSKTRK